MNYDTTPAGELQTFLQKGATKKSATMRMAELGRDVIKPGMINRAIGCGNYITLLHDAEMQNHRVETGYFCGGRLCPGCSWRKAAKDAVQISCIMQAATNDGHQLLFATLTAQNVPAEQLKDAIAAYDTAYTQMMRRGKYRRILGAIRKLEITYNAKTCTYHPHIHSVWIVPKSWIKYNRRKKEYICTEITREEMERDWSTALQGKYYTTAQAQDIRYIKSASREDIREFAKYPAKSGDYLRNKDVFETFYLALKGVRLITYTKLAKKLKAAYKAGELNQYADADTNTYFYRSYYEYQREGLYELERIEQLDEPKTYEIIDTDETIE